jgi:tripartite-type tricarboxylate transporter receptor subunit TctC
MKRSCLAACYKIALAFALAHAMPTMAAQLEGRSVGDQAYPNRPIRLLVGLPAGGSTDVMARIVAAKLGDALGQQVVVENRPGSGGLIAAETAARAQPDGHTLLFGAISYSAIFASLYKNLPYDPVKDFAPISLVTKLPNVLVVNPTLPVRSVSEFIAHAKANPGKLSYGSSGAGTSLHLSMEMLKKQAGIEVVHVPYKGGPAAVVDLLAGRIQVMFDNLPGQIANVKSGRARALAVTTAKRNFLLPEVATMMEAGVPGFEVTVWYGMFAPARVPRPIVAKLNAELVKTLNMPEVRERMAEQGAEPAPTTREEFAAFQKAEVAKWAKVVKDSGATAE